MKHRSRDLTSKRKNDVIFIVASLLICTALGLGFYLFRSEGDTVTVTIDGAITGEYSLGEDAAIPILNGSGECTNLLVIQNGKAYVESASCPDGICVDHRPISKNGESIVCLPNRVVVKISSTDEKTPDIIT